MPDRTRFIDLIKTISIFALTISMLVLAGVYIDARQNTGVSEEIPWEKRRIFENASFTASVPGSSLILPERITVTADGKSYTAVCDADLISTLFDSFKYTLLGVFAESSSADSADETLWKECILAEDSLYFRFAGDYLPEVFRTYFSSSTAAPTVGVKSPADGTEPQGRQIYFTKELILANGGKLCATRDSSGNVTKISPDEFILQLLSSQLTGAELSAYTTNAGVIPCAYPLRDDYSDSLISLPASFQAESGAAAYSSCVTAGNPLTDQSGVLNSRSPEVSELLKNLKINAESAVFVGSGGQITVIDNHAEITLTSGTLNPYRTAVLYRYKDDTYRAGEGLHLSRFLGYDSDYFTFGEKLRAAGSFIGSLPAGVIGEGISPVLSDISAEQNGRIVYTFAYYYSGVKIMTDGSYTGASVTINGNMITDISLISIAITPEERIKNTNVMIAVSAVKSGITDIMNAEGEQSRDERIAEAEKDFNISYDKITDKFTLPGIDLVYNIDTENAEGIITASRVVN
ncbi:hypothetical protein FACS1894105_07090 [Clostridia bacterium]|nr:hypothetical protein FACS1894105_07090 [Clostridia bacterium]